jgi:hypothetical protein
MPANMAAAGPVPAGLHVRSDVGLDIALNEALPAPGAAALDHARATARGGRESRSRGRAAGECGATAAADSCTTTSAANTATGASGHTAATAAMSSALGIRQSRQRRRECQRNSDGKQFSFHGHSPTQFGSCL